MAEQTPPKIEFPCENYPIKIMGVAGDALHQCVIEVVTRHAPEFDSSNIKVRDSRQGSFQSLTVWITATGEPQLRALHEELIASDLVKMVL